MLPSYRLALGCLLVLAPLGRGESPGRVLEEVWESAFLDGARVGSVHTTVREQGGSPRLLRASAALELTFRNHNALMRLRSENGTEETPEGKVVGVFLRQGQPGGKQLLVIGEVEDSRLHVRVDNGRIDRRIPWNEEAVGLYRLQHLFAEKKPKAGERFSFYRYEPILTTMVKMQVVIKEPEEVRPPLGGSPRKLLRVEMRMEPIETPRMTVQLPGEVWWLDEHFDPVQRQKDLDNLGTLTLVRTTRAAATAEVGTAHMADLGARGLIPLNRTIRRPYFTRSANYRITIKGEENAASLLANGGHQEVHNAQGETFELEVHPLQPGRDRPEGSEEAAREYLGSSHYINGDDEEVRELARRAVGTETDPWQKARRIERYVKQRMRPDNAALPVPAGEVARKLCGDCRLYAFLTTAMCRAENIPARTAIGLLYVERGGRPQMGFHMWTEVWIGGRWLGLDATLGLGRVSAGHIKVSDHSWDGVQSLTPILPAQRLLGKLRIEVLRVEGPS